jgi:cold-inducible RNA-binding protein
MTGTRRSENLWIVTLVLVPWADRIKENDDMGRRLYIGNLAYGVTEQELRDLFSEGGANITDLKVILDRETGRSRGFAFVEMSTDAEAAQAVETLNGRDVQGRAISVSEARERSGGGGGGGSGGYGGGGGSSGGGPRGGGGGRGGDRPRRGGW